MPDFTFAAAVIHWRGPAPYYFTPIPPEVCAAIAAKAKALSYGWGVIPVVAEIDRISFYTSLFPKDGGYLLPLKAKVRTQLGADALESLTVALTLGKPG